MKKFSTVLVCTISLLSMACSENRPSITVYNETDSEIGYRLVQIPVKSVFESPEIPNFFITDAQGEEIPSQLTYDSLIVFPVNLSPGESSTFFVNTSDTLHRYPNLTEGYLYPNRQDDLSYENEFNGYRIYGPGTRANGEKAFGYDIFFKHPTTEIVLPQLYEAQTSGENWAKADSLRKIDKALAQDFIDSFTYHIDHGKGMDCYAVGPTLGDGVAAILLNDSIFFPWCFERANILDNGPLRFSAELIFPPMELRDGETITEHRLISLDAGARLNDCIVWYEGLGQPVEIVAGFPLRDESAPVADVNQGILIYSDPTQGPDNGRALLGLKMGVPVDSVFEKEGHILISSHLNPQDSLHYKWGFSWDKTDFPNAEEWKKHIELQAKKYSVKLNTNNRK